MGLFYYWKENSKKRVTNFIMHINKQLTINNRLQILVK
jgi:hypothetical protein